MLTLLSLSFLCLLDPQQSTTEGVRTMEAGSPFDAAPFAMPLEGEAGIAWEDPREIHRVIARFQAPPPDDLQLQYWKAVWPEHRLPKDHVPSGGAAGWWGLGDWYTGEWQTADAEQVVEGNTVRFTFRPLHEKEFPQLSDFPATYRTTLKLRLVSASELPGIESLSAETDSTWERATLTLLWASPPPVELFLQAFNGRLETVQRLSPTRARVTLWQARHPDPNSFDATLLTVEAGEVFTVRLDDLTAGPLYLPDFGVCVVGGEEERDYTDVVSELLINARQGVHQAIGALPEQTWERAWRNMPPKQRRLYLPLATDGGRHKFRLNPDGSVFWRTNNHYLIACPGRDTERLQADRANLHVSFDLPDEPLKRTIAEETLPIGLTVWEMNGVRLEQVALVTPVEGTDPDGPPPAADATGVCLARFAFENISPAATEARLPVRFADEAVRVDGEGWLRVGARVRGQLDTGGRGELVEEEDAVVYRLRLQPGERHAVVLKLPYVEPQGEEAAQLQALDFATELQAVTRYWRRRLDAGMRLLTPEPMLNEYYRAHAGHLLINCEKEPGSDRRFARVGSFRYAVYGNESCMMIVDLDRRGYHEEARQCLEAFLQYQGTVALPGDYSSQDGVLYGAHGYECGGYNQHHGWILWCLVEHYKFTRDVEWLRRSTPHLLAASDWIIRERARTFDRDDIGRGLLPMGSLEDITDWWQWMSTNLYSWRGLDAAAWGLEQLDHPQATRLRQQADDYRQAILRAFTEAAQRSPVVRLRDGTCVPHFPSHPHRRGRSFGWIREVLEGAIHLLITRILDANSKEALWILRDYEDNLFLSDHYGYHVEDFDRQWFDLGGFSLQANLLLDVEPYLYRDEVKHALRAMFNAMAAYYFPDTRMMTEHALVLGEWRGDHYKSSDEANAAGWLRYLFVREEGDELLLGQAVPREWLAPGRTVGVEGAATYFGPMSLFFEADEQGITARLRGPQRNPPAQIRLRFRAPEGRAIRSVQVNGRRWTEWDEQWVRLPGDIGEVVVRAEY